MVLCLVALPVFAVLGIFSLKYRKLAKDALDCLLRTVTFRKCHSGLDARIKAGITGKILKRSPKAGRFIYRHYKIFSWIVLILLVWSTYASAVGIYNYVQYGNCNGPESTGFCLLDPTGSQSAISDVGLDVQGEIIYPEIEEDDPIIGPPDAELTVIEFGCYICPYTKKAEKTVAEVIKHYDGRVNFQFKTFIIPRHELSYQASLAANCALDQGKYKEYHDRLFELQESLTESTFMPLAEEVGLDPEEFRSCMETEKFGEEVRDDTLAGTQAGVPGTPVFFVGEQSIVGPKPFRTFENIIDEALE